MRGWRGRGWGMSVGMWERRGRVGMLRWLGDGGGR